jgi:hypothetical protein
MTVSTTDERTDGPDRKEPSGVACRQPDCDAVFLSAAAEIGHQSLHAEADP